MQIFRDENEIWQVILDEQERQDKNKFNDWYMEAMPRYLNALDLAFRIAQESNEFEFILCLLRVRGIEDAGWDPFETTLKVIPNILKIHSEITNNIEAARHISLWTYGHILEASEPYELLANLIDVVNGGTFIIRRFPPKGNRPQSPGEKIQKLSEMAKVAGVSDVVIPLVEIWNRNLRNAIFHADYALFGEKVRTIRPSSNYTHEDIMELINRTLAYHQALAGLFEAYIESYNEPKIIKVDPRFSRDPEEMATIIVRKNKGLAGLKDSWNMDQLKAGKIPFRIGRFTPNEISLLDSNPLISVLQD
ncbi:hypothetical protein [Desulfosporosinus meridiei]|uniref:Uncharacterized protein n=1 Tax=Desulfosporosinus meridiei (strain ATCC BAA-275 / DSM 13257 / KCTC 12902 / NCIMB 13706 / S10) TaxID=768704 RepID=J7IRT8_DESMD|nr:hypothetical protein [Desulfosporosinus meridiei]AFQ44360.1 hypothetical protein Desmer_2441 [Desulfosporosinus meridiei DSM 13257]